MVRESGRPLFKHIFRRHSRGCDQCLWVFEVSNIRNIYLICTHGYSATGSGQTLQVSSHSTDILHIQQDGTTHTPTRVKLLLSSAPDPLQYRSCLRYSQVGFFAPPHTPLISLPLISRSESGIVQSLCYMDRARIRCRACSRRS
jgi:hypothetical protein